MSITSTLVRGLAIAFVATVADAAEPMVPGAFTTKVTTLSEQGGEIRHAEFLNDGKTLVTCTGGTSRGKLKLWDARTGQEQAVDFILPDNAGVDCFAISPNGKWLAAASTRVVERRKEQIGVGSIILFDMATGKRFGDWEAHDGYVTDLDFSPDSELLASSGKDHLIKIWTAASAKELAVLKSHTESVAAVAFSPDGKCIASAGYDGAVKLWEVADGRLRCSLTGQEDAAGRKETPPSIRALAYSSDGDLLATANDAGQLIIWDVAKEVPRTSIAISRGGPIYSLAFGPGDRIIAVGGRVAACFVDVRRGKELDPLPEHTKAVYTLAYSSDGKLLVTGDARTARVWTGNVNDETPVVDHKRPPRGPAPTEDSLTTTDVKVGPNGAITRKTKVIGSESTGAELPAKEKSADERDDRLSKRSEVDVEEMTRDQVKIGLAVALSVVAAGVIRLLIAVPFVSHWLSRRFSRRKRRS